MSDALTAEYERWCDAFHEGSNAVKRIAQETLDLRAEVERFKRQCKIKRAIAIDMAAHVAEQFQHLPRAELKQRILHLIDMSQMEHDALVIRYRIRDRHGESK